MKQTLRVVSVYPNFANKGGAQNVVLQLADRLNEGERPIVMCDTPKMQVVADYRQRAHFVGFGYKAVKRLADENTIFISHHRKCTTLLVLMQQVLGKKLKVIHVAHNIFNNLRWGCFFPRYVVAVSNGVKENLLNYFRVPENHVKVIWNGIRDERNNRNVKEEHGVIDILLPGRICAVKQQVELVKHMRGRLPKHVRFSFAGLGADEVLLKQVIMDDPRFRYLGFVNMSEVLNRFDYVCLFSQKEGLGLSLIEGCMFGKPLITNNLPAVLDVNRPGETGFAYADFDALLKGLNELPLPGSESYMELSRNARQRYEMFFTEERMIAQYRELITEVSENRK